jgi:transposase-like protein
MLMIERLSAGWSVSSVAAAFGVDPKTVSNWRDHKRTGPYTPRTNGKAERFIQTSARVGLCRPLRKLR